MQVLIFLKLNNKKEQKITSLFTIIVTIQPLGALVTFAEKPKLVQRKQRIVIAWKVRRLLAIKCSLGNTEQFRAKLEQQYNHLSIRYIN